MKIPKDKSEFSTEERENLKNFIGYLESRMNLYVWNTQFDMLISSIKK